jgi:enoyl-CoA hydratase
MSREFKHVQLKTVARVGWLEFARPPVNAFDRAMVAETHDVIVNALADPQIRVLVLASAVDRYFSAGADLAAFDSITIDGMRSWVELCHTIARLLRGSSKPVLAAINGTAVGGGLEMTLHCDIRFAASDARLGQPEIRIAFIPPIATTQALVRLIGRPRTLRYLNDGRLVEADDALKWGLVDELVPPAQLRSRVQAYAEELCAKPAAALAAVRQLVTLGGGKTFEEGMGIELEAAVALSQTVDFQEGVSAFLQKRQARWEA